MDLKKQIDDKLLEIKEIISRTDEEYKSCYNLINSFFIKESLDDNLNKHFALKKKDIEKAYKDFCNLIPYYESFAKHKEIISDNNKALINAMSFLEELRDKISFVLAEFKATIISLENWLK